MLVSLEELFVVCARRRLKAGGSQDWLAPQNSGAATLPDHARTQLDFARVVGLAADQTERRVSRVQLCGGAKGHAIGSIERFGPQLQVTALAEREALEHGHVQVLGGVAPQIVEVGIEGPDVVGQLLGADRIELSGV